MTTVQDLRFYKWGVKNMTPELRNELSSYLGPWFFPDPIIMKKKEDAQKRIQSLKGTMADRTLINKAKADLKEIEQEITLGMSGSQERYITMMNFLRWDDDSLTGFLQQQFAT